MATMKITTYRLTPEESKDMDEAKFLTHFKLLSLAAKYQAGITVLLDVSISMGDNAVRICEYLANYVKEIPIGSDLVIILFGNVPELVLSTKSLTTEEKENTITRLKEITTKDLHDCTNLSAGLNIARDDQMKSPSYDGFEMIATDGSERSRSMLLLLDGHVNAGEKRKECLVAMIEALNLTAVVNIMFGTGASHEFANAIQCGLKNGKSYFIEPGIAELQLDIKARLMEAECANQADIFKIGNLELYPDASTLFNGISCFMKESDLFPADSAAHSLDKVIVDTGFYGQVDFLSTLVESRSTKDDEVVKFAIQTEKIKTRLNKLCGIVTQDSIDKDVAKMMPGETDAIISGLKALNTDDNPSYRSLSDAMMEQAEIIQQAFIPRKVLPTIDNARQDSYSSLSVGEKRSYDEVDAGNFTYRSLGCISHAPVSSSVTLSVPSKLPPHRLASVRKV